MPARLELAYQGQADLYAVLRRPDDAAVWSHAARTFTSWSDADLPAFAIALEDRGGDLHQAPWPDDAPPGRYRIAYYRRDGETPAASDLLLAAADVVWTGAALDAPGEVALPPDALCDLAAVRRRLHLTEPAHDALLAELIHAASRRIERLCGRRFTLTRHRQWVAPRRHGCVLLAQYPVTRVFGVRRLGPTGLRLRYVGQARRAQVSVEPGAICLATVDPAGLSHETTVPLDDSLTTLDVAGMLKAVGGWQADSLLPAPAVELAPASAVDAIAGPVLLRVAGEVTPARIDPAAGVARLRTAPGEAVLLDYQAGFDPIPADLAQAAVELVVQAFWLSRRDPNARRETLGASSVWLVDQAVHDDALLRRLRPYQALPIAPGDG